MDIAKSILLEDKKHTSAYTWQSFMKQFLAAQKSVTHDCKCEK